MSSPLAKDIIISDWEDNLLPLTNPHQDAAAFDPSTSPDDSSSSSPSIIPKHRLCKTKHSPVYFSDSDDDQEEEPADSYPKRQFSPEHNNKQPLIQPTLTQPTRFQQQHHRRHRQFHRTFTPFDLRQLNTTEAVDDHQQPAGIQSSPPTNPKQQQSSDETDANDLTTSQPPPRHPSYRDSPGHHRVNKPQPPSSPQHTPSHLSSALQLAAGFGGEAKKRRRSRIMLINYGPESICVLALILTTFATFQNVPPKISKIAPPQPFFPKGSLVQDYPGGNLNVVQDRVKLADISMVMFYAPWSAECQFARRSYEQVAGLFGQEVHFAAVNCWQPGGECRNQYAKIHDWPVAMAYMKSGLAVPYTGRWSTASVTRFVQSLMLPVHRIVDNEDMLRLMMSHDAVVVAFVDVNQYAEDYAAYYSTAIKWLEQDPFQTVAFAIVTGASAVAFDVHQNAPLVRTYLWNGTMEYESTNVWTQPKLSAWIAKQLIRVSAWLNPPGTKANTLAPFLRSGPLLVLFTPRSMDVGESIDAYDMLRQLGLEYNNCESVNQSWIRDMSRVYITGVRNQNHHDFQQFNSACDRIIADAKRAQSAALQCAFRSSPHTTSLHHSVSLSSHINSSKLPVDFCQIGPRNLGESSYADDEYASCSAMPRECGKLDATPSLESSMSFEDEDPRSARNLMNRSMRKRCQILSSGRRGDLHPQVEFFETVDHLEQFERIAGLGCNVNRSLGFVALDSTLYHVFAERLGVDVLAKSDQTAAVIVDHENESSYVMTEPMSTVGLIDFVQNFTTRRLNRFLNARTVDLFDKQRVNASSSESTSAKCKHPTNARNNSRGRNVNLRDVDSHSFNEVVLNSNKTVFVLFHSAQCAMCSVLAQALLMVAHLLNGMQWHVDFVRIDGDRNDLPWHYTIDQYPTLIAFPPVNSALDSRMFPTVVSATVPNVLAFVLANLRRPQRLHALLLVCHRVRNPGDDCTRTLRREVSDSIALSLRQWRSAPHRRNSILRRLQALQRLYLQLHRLDTSQSSQENNIIPLAMEVSKVWKSVVT